MADTRRRRQYEDLRGILAQQLSAAADDWSPRPRQPFQEAARSERDVRADPVMEKIHGQELQIDDVAAVLRRCFDYEAAEWLLRCMAVSTVREIR